MARPSLPTLTALQCFEAAARHQSFTRAADELHLTQSAVSKQVAQLEHVLEKFLFRRVRKRLQITPEGALYITEARRILSQAEMSVRQMRSYSGRSERLKIATPPTFGARWLIPNLNDFRVQNPQIDLDIRNRTEPLDFDTDPMDVALFFGNGVLPGAECIKLLHEEVAPVCAPQLIADTPITDPLDLTELVLLQTLSRPEAWHDWFEAQGRQTDHSYHGPRFETFDMALWAARTGGGVALVPKFLVTEELESGQLIVPWRFSLPHRNAYYVAYPENTGEVAKIKAFVSWLTGHATVASDAQSHE
ncbi:transcriptional regulator GcvA [Salinisphaera sp. USBA-960]|uniref:transcriptional regulator GcvA n=1 Tax=Salinisphaera orenii TaxID=856731 RepID=UPI000DBE450A|nr:transcriptional regulator GcvA [Salifodinibacter halophilus]NNC26234.1 transcriptional regulator GcvA [Salifodinibacter halophilus]